MCFKKFDTITWDNTTDLRSNTYVQPPTRFKFALQQAQHAILRAIMHHGRSEPAWKVLVLCSWLLLGRPATNASDSNCFHFLEANFTSSGRKTGQPCGPWSVPNATLLPFREVPPNQLPSTNNLVSTRLLHLLDQVNAAGPWLQPEMPRQSQPPLIRTLL